MSRDLDQAVDRILGLVKNVGGFLTDREIRFLALAASYSGSQGDVLEIGCYQGKSTIVLGIASQLPRPTRLVSIDPAKPDCLAKNLQMAGIDGVVEFHQDYSQSFLTQWRRPIRLLWHDGANVYADVKRDIELATPYLSDRAIVAFHDVLNTSGERIRNYCDDVLGSAHFGPVGICGSIGWGMFRTQVKDAARFATNRSRLARQLSRLIPFHLDEPAEMTGWRKSQYRMLRWLVPHGEVNPDRWLKQVA